MHVHRDAAHQRPPSARARHRVGERFQAYAFNADLAVRPLDWRALRSARYRHLLPKHDRARAAIERERRAN
jgi:hypothetical protein